MSSTDRPKTFSTAARVYPPLKMEGGQVRHTQSLASPKLPRVPGSKKWVIPAVAVCALGAAVAADRVGQTQRHHTQTQTSSAEALRRHNEAMMNAYGDKESLEDLEKAIQQYEKR